MTDSMNQSVYEEPAAELTLKPRVRTYREKSGRTSIRDTAQEKAQARKQAVEQMKQDWKRIGELEREGQDRLCRPSCDRTESQGDPSEMALRRSGGRRLCCQDGGRKELYA